MKATEDEVDVCRRQYHGCLNSTEGPDSSTRIAPDEDQVTRTIDIAAYLRVRVVDWTELAYS